MTETPSDPYSHWRRRAETAEAEVARLNMEMQAYRQKLTPKDVEAMTAVVKALQAAKDSRVQACERTLSGEHWWITQDDGSLKCQSCNLTQSAKAVKP